MDTGVRKYVYLSIVIAGCCSAGSAHTMDDYGGMVFPANHALNSPVDSLPVHPNSDAFITSIGAETRFHPDFGSTWDDGGTERPMGIPYNVVGADQPLQPITWTDYGDESDPGPWPIPADPYIETVLDWRDTDDGDRHLIIVDSGSNRLYESWYTFGPAGGAGWKAANGAVFDLASCALRPDTWTSGDAAGLPIFPLLIRYDEVEEALEHDGAFPHAIRFTVQKSQKAYHWPARHFASQSTDKNLPPMGLRFRLKAGYDISGYPARMQVILRSMKKYGIIVADNGGNWFFQGTHDDRWDDEEINTLKQLRGNNFEAVDITPWLEHPDFDPNSAAVPGAAEVTSGPVRPHSGSGLQVYLSGAYGAGRRITARCTLRQAGTVRIEIGDLKGSLTAVVTGAVVSEGTHLFSFDAPLFTSGMLLVRLYSNGTVAGAAKIPVIR